MDSLENNFTVSTLFKDTPLTRTIKLSVFVVLTPPAVICNGILVYYLLFDRTYRRTLHNHAILALLIATLLTNIIEIPRTIHFLHVGTVIPQTDINCLIWQWFDYLLFAMVNVMILWISIERHLMIFYGHFYATARSRFLYHYLPLIVIVVYLILFYIVMIFIYPCDQSFDFNQPLCGVPCYTLRSEVSIYDFMAHTWIPLTLGMILDISLVVRVIYRKRVGLQHQAAQQRKHRKMAIQVLSISALYIAFEAPSSMVLFSQLFVVISDSIMYIQIVYLYYMFWILTLLIPITCIRCNSEVVIKFKNILLQ